jgi:histidinol-phosphatase
MRHWLPLLEDIANTADAIALRYFRRTDLSVSTKSNLTPVSEADLAIESATRKIVAARHPELGMLGEEEGATGPTSERLILDPIDATRNFVRGIPVFATLIAVEIEHEIVAGMVSAPALGTRWHAERGAGAWSGGRRLSVSRINTWTEAQVFHGSLGGSESTKWSARVAELSARAHRDRGFGDFWQHVLVAEGAGELALDPGTSPWDVAPLMVIVEEAGGRATSLEGERTIYGGGLVSSNGVMHELAIAALRAESVDPAI